MRAQARDTARHERIIGVALDGEWGHDLCMETRVEEVAERIYQLSTYVPEADFTFNQYLLDADEPLLFHTGLRHLFPLVADAVATVVPVERLRWVSFGHFEADECGSMNEWLRAAPSATVAHSTIGVLVSVEDLADRPPHSLNDGDVLDLGTKQVRHVYTPHVPHAWDAGLLYEETTKTLLCGDLFGWASSFNAMTDGDLRERAAAAEDLFHATALTPATAPTIRRLAELDIETLAPMHAPAFSGDCRAALLGLADDYEARMASAA